MIRVLAQIKILRVFRILRGCAANKARKPRRLLCKYMYPISHLKFFFRTNDIYA